MLIFRHLKTLLMLSVALTVFLGAAKTLAEPILIHSPDLQGEDFSNTSLLRIYAMQKRLWSDNTPVRVFTLPNGSDIHKKFVAKYLHMQSYQLDRLWHRLLFSGTGSIPEEVSSMEQMIEKVKNTPGAIGYIDSEYADQLSNAMKTESVNE